MQTTKASGIGCKSQADILMLSTCVPSQARDCERERAALIERASCASIPRGISVWIEAGSHSFAWLRIRVPGHPEPLWTDRKLALEH